MIFQGVEPPLGILNREMEKRRGGEKLSISELIDVGDERVIEAIERECFSVQTYGELQPERMFLVKKFSETISAERKNKLKHILYQHKPEMVDRLERAGFSFKGTCS